MSKFIDGDFGPPAGAVTVSGHAVRSGPLRRHRLEFFPLTGSGIKSECALFGGGPDKSFPVPVHMSAYASHAFGRAEDFDRSGLGIQLAQTSRRSLTIARPA